MAATATTAAIQSAPSVAATSTTRRNASAAVVSLMSGTLRSSAAATAIALMQNAKTIKSCVGTR